ncbi:TorD/DmsD family molecular chaperone [Desulfitobacterium chlororespirans]|uniref:Chaperone TorD involved in molybdoenzyme TorA maturation n=1 Tax=Desulfitobacterium chlororespirans DSM 11544 TaxID=1121395 RepID=A0A1M7S5G5_9FIRM|nr:molecular chaperone TorD family protein [Desulfitobacterium chlororespirans]SHN53663.1 chaperone TorD involved in molybdoenzyme TorA maturation [Desulfitobacterium chlororespirans DSM 11544]
MGVHEGRLYVYQLLKYLFEQPLNPESLKQLQEQPGLKELAHISSGAQSINDFLVTNKDDYPETLCQALQAEYQRLFVGPGQVLVPIWESVYFDPEHLMFGERTLAVREFYCKYHLESIHKNRQPEDHLAVELEFMIYLIGQYLASEDGVQQTELLRDQKEFIQKHLATWKDEFLQFLEKSTNCLLYRGGGQLLKEFLDMECEMFEHLEEVS